MQKFCESVLNEKKKVCALYLRNKLKGLLQFTQLPYSEAATP